MSSSYLPLPFDAEQYDDVGIGFFEACQRRQFTVQRCLSCGHFQHPPRAICQNCHSLELEWAPVSGKGTIFTYTVIHHGPGALGPYVPYNVVNVELEGTSGARVISNVVDVEPEKLEIGLPVEVTWEESATGAILPRFKRA